MVAFVRGWIPCFVNPPFFLPPIQKYLHYSGLLNSFKSIPQTPIDQWSGCPYFALCHAPTKTQLIRSNSDLSCSICFHEYNYRPYRPIVRPRLPDLEDEGAIQLECGHIFGIMCLNKWIQNGNDCCPLCQRRIVYDKVTGRLRRIRQAHAEVLKHMKRIFILLEEKPWTGLDLKDDTMIDRVFSDLLALMRFLVEDERYFPLETLVFPSFGNGLPPQNADEVKAWRERLRESYGLVIRHFRSYCLRYVDTLNLSKMIIPNKFPTRYPSAKDEEAEDDY